MAAPDSASCGSGTTSTKVHPDEDAPCQDNPGDCVGVHVRSLPLVTARLATLGRDVRGRDRQRDWLCVAAARHAVSETIGRPSAHLWRQTGAYHAALTS